MRMIAVKLLCPRLPDWHDIQGGLASIAGNQIYFSLNHFTAETFTSLQEPAVLQDARLSINALAAI